MKKLTTMLAIFTLLLTSIKIYAQNLEAENIELAFEKLYLEELDELFNQGASFTFSGFGQLSLDIPLSDKTTNNLKPHVNNCLPDSPSRIYSVSGSDFPKLLSVSIKPLKIGIDASFQLTFSDGKLAAITGSGDPRFKTSEGLSVGQTIKEVRNLYQNRPDIKYLEKKLDTRFIDIYIQHQLQEENTILIIHMAIDYVTGFEIYSPGAKIQAHDCGDFYTMDSWNDIQFEGESDNSTDSSSGLPSVDATFKENVFTESGTFNFSGTITSISDSDNLLRGIDIIPGSSTFKGSFSYDPTSPAETRMCTSQRGKTFKCRGGTFYKRGELSVVIDKKYRITAASKNKVNFYIKDFQNDDYIQILNDEPLIKDQFNFLSSDFIMFNYSEWDAPKSIQIILRDSSQSVFSDESLPVEIDVSNFDEHSISIGASRIGKHFFNIKGNITSLVKIPCDMPCSTVKYSKTVGAKLTLYHQATIDNVLINKLVSLKDEEEWGYYTSYSTTSKEVDLDRPGLYEVFFNSKKEDIWKQRVYVPFHSPDNADQLAQKFAPILAFHEKEEYYPLKLSEILDFIPNDGLYPLTYGGDAMGLESKASNLRKFEIISGSEKQTLVEIKKIKKYLKTHGHSEYLIKTRHKKDETYVIGTGGHYHFLNKLYKAKNNKIVTYYSIQKIKDKTYISYFFIFAYDPKRGPANIPGEHIFDRESIVVTLDSNNELLHVTYGAHLPNQRVLFFGCKDNRDNCNDNPDLNDFPLVGWRYGRVKILESNIKALGSHPVLFFAEGSHGIFPAPGWYRVINRDATFKNWKHLPKDWIIDATHLDEPAFNLAGKKTFFPEESDYYDLVEMNLNEDEEPWFAFSGYWIDGFGKHDGRLPPFIRQPDLWVKNAQFAFTKNSVVIKDYLSDEGEFKEFGIGKKGAITGLLIDKDGQAIKGANVCTDEPDNKCTETFFDGSFTLIVSTKNNDSSVNKKINITKARYKDCTVENIDVKTAQRFTFYGSDISTFNCVIKDFYDVNDLDELKKVRKIILEGVQAEDMAPVVQVEATPNPEVKGEDYTIIKAIEDNLKKGLPNFWCGMTGELIELNSIEIEKRGTMINEKYIPVQARIKGKCRPQSFSYAIVPGIKDFEAVGDFKIYQDDYGDWKAYIDKI